MHDILRPYSAFGAGAKARRAGRYNARVDQTPPVVVSSRILTIPNVLSLFRLAMVPVFLMLVVAGEDVFPRGAGLRQRHRLPRRHARAPTRAGHQARSAPGSSSRS